MARIVSSKGRVYEYPPRPRKLGRKPTVHHPDFTYKNRQPGYYRHQVLFLLRRQQLLEMYHNSCSQCGVSGVTLDIHHKDGVGYSRTDNPNNNIENLEILCSSCHQRKHNGTGITLKAVKALREDGLTYNAIGSMFGVSRQRVHQIALKK